MPTMPSVFDDKPKVLIYIPGYRLAAHVVRTCPPDKGQRQHADDVWIRTRTFVRSHHPKRYMTDTDRFFFDYWIKDFTRNGNLPVPNLHIPELNITI